VFHLNVENGSFKGGYNNGFSCLLVSIIYACGAILRIATPKYKKKMEINSVDLNQPEWILS